MVKLDEQYCIKCEGVTKHYNGVCYECAELQRREQMAIWQAKTVEEKLLDLHERLLSIESGPKYS